MNKKILISIGIIIVAFIALYLAKTYTSTPDKMAGETPTPEMMMKKDDEAMMKKSEDSSMMNSLKHYSEYSSTALTDSLKNKRVLFFYANWCPTCRPADAAFRENDSKIPSDVSLIRVNYNDSDTDQEEKELAKKYLVTYQHTFVQIDEAGKEVTRWNGGQLTELINNIQ